MNRESGQRIYIAVAHKRDVRRVNALLGEYAGRITVGSGGKQKKTPVYINELEKLKTEWEKLEP